MSQMFAWIWRWLVPERQSIYDRQLLVLAFSLMSVGLVMVASASITEGVSLQNDAFFFVKRHLIFLVLCLLCGIGTLYVPVRYWQQWGGQLLIFSILMLLLVLVAAHSMKGANRGLPLGP